MNAPTAAERSALISQHLGVSRPYSAAASDLIDRLLIDLAEAQDLDPVEEARLLADLIGQASARLSRHLGGR